MHHEFQEELLTGKVVGNQSVQDGRLTILVLMKEILRHLWCPKPKPSFSVFKAPEVGPIFPQSTI